MKLSVYGYVIRAVRGLFASWSPRTRYPLKLQIKRSLCATRKAMGCKFTISPLVTARQ
jgi:hypothetical protein